MLTASDSGMGAPLGSLNAYTQTSLRLTRGSVPAGGCRRFEVTVHGRHGAPGEGYCHRAHSVATTTMISRRTLLKGGALASATAGALSYAAIDVASGAVSGDITPEHVTVRLPSLPAAFDGYRIGFLTDIHLGIWVPDEWVTESLELLKAERCNILVLGGDYIGIPDSKVWERLGIVRNQKFTGLTHRTACEKLFPAARSLVGQIPFPDGIIAVAGNHEHWNSSRIFLETFRSTPGFTLLRNEFFSISRGGSSLTLYGTDDFLTGIPYLPRPTSSNNQLPARCEILISHNPDLVAFGLMRDGERFRFDLSLCGHTHGGQIRIPGLGAATYQVAYTKFGAGLASEFGKQIYTSRGLGVVSVPFRIGCPPEVTVLELRG
jgi:predicted MPP superfamily phosphohydrolase